MKKTAFIVLLCVVLLGIVGGLMYYSPSKTLDYRGVVTEIKHDSGTYTFYLESPTEATYVVIAKDSIPAKLQDKDGEEISVADIAIGDTIEGDYKKWFADDNEAKHITVSKANLPASEK